MLFVGLKSETLSRLAVVAKPAGAGLHGGLDQYIAVQTRSYPVSLGDAHI